MAVVAAAGAAPRPSLRKRLAARGIDSTTLLVLPGVILTLVLFIYPCIYGVVDSLSPAKGPWYANYKIFFTDPFQYKTIAATLWLSVPVTIINVVVAIPIAFRVRLMRRQRLLTTILVLPITLGTVLVADGLLNFLGPRGWFNKSLMFFDLIEHPIRLTNNYWGVFASLVITGFPFAFLLTLSYVSGIDPAIEQAAATLGAKARQRFFKVFLPLLVPGLAITFCLSFVQAFSVFPSAILLGAPSGPTRVIAIAAYQAAFEQYNHSLGAAIAIIMGLAQLLVVVIVLGLRSLFYRGPAGGTKG